MHVAVETGARFVRERIEQDALEWMLTPRRLFGGEAAAVACTAVEGYRRALLLHGLSLGLDASPDQLSGMPARSVAGIGDFALSLIPPDGTQEPDEWPEGEPALYCACISSHVDETHIQIFSAMIAKSPAEVRLRLRRRLGALLESEAKVTLGFDSSEPLACSLVSDAMADILTMAAEDPASAVADGLDFQVEQRFLG
jgi:hypothetical protein